MNSFAEKVCSNLFSNYPEAEARIQHGIELFRKGTLEIELLDQAGTPVDYAEVEFSQVRHEYQFGCNGFMFQQFESIEQNEAHDRSFLELFNLVVVPFYWSDLEPTEGQARFDRNSPPRWRRPAPDLLLDWAESNNIAPKGHLLTYHQFLPDWLKPGDKIDLRWEKHIQEIAERYGKRISDWDVANEALTAPPGNPRMPRHPVETAFALAERYLPYSARLNYNEHLCWSNLHDGYTPVNLLAENLLLRGHRLSALGLQFHMLATEPKDFISYWGNGMLNQEVLIDSMDTYAQTGLPFSISEVTLTAHEALGEDREEFQAKIAERLYRLWFSHPATTGIIYWNLVDDTAYSNGDWNENIYKGGLLRNDAHLSAKPVYQVLKRLIREEWQTSGKLHYSGNKKNYFRGFYGDYKLKIKTCSGKERVFDIKLSKKGKNLLKLSGDF